MKRFVGALALLMLTLGVALPASAQNFVQDQAGMFSASTVAQLNTRIGNFNAQTGKAVLVVTVASLNGQTIAAAARQTAQQQGLNGVIVFISKGDMQDIILPGHAEVLSGWFTSDTTANIRQPMEAQFKAEHFNGGITTAVGTILNMYRSHLGSVPSRGAGAPVPVAAQTQSNTSGGFHFGMFTWIIILVIGFLIVRSVMRTSARRNYGAVPMQPGTSLQPGGPPAAPSAPVAPGVPGYGGGGFGGGNFWSGMLGGLGGAFIGNELFGNRGGMMGGEMQGGAIPPGGSAGGWANDAGQTDMGGASGGDFGGGGFGDIGDGGGGDFGGGGW